MVGTCVTPRLITKESNLRANERKKEAWQAKESVIRLVDEKIQNGLFIAKEDGRRQNWMVDKHRTYQMAEYLKKKNFSWN